MLIQVDHDTSLRHLRSVAASLLRCRDLYSPTLLDLLVARTQSTLLLDVKVSGSITAADDIPRFRTARPNPDRCSAAHERPRPC